MAIPISYNIRNLKLRKGLTIMTALGIALTVTTALFIMALLAGLQQAFDPLKNVNAALQAASDKAAKEEQKLAEKANSTATAMGNLIQAINQMFTSLMAAVQSTSTSKGSSELSSTRLAATAIPRRLKCLLARGARMQFTFPAGCPGSLALPLLEVVRGINASIGRSRAGRR